MLPVHHLQAGTVRDDITNPLVWQISSASQHVLAISEVPSNRNVTWDGQLLNECAPEVE